MDFVASLIATAAKQDLRFLVIGGQAVWAWGVTRETADFDILVNREDQVAWKTSLADLEFTVFNDGGNFLQLTSPAFPAWPLDLMLVAPPTFSKMYSNAVTKNLLHHPLNVPSLLHLIALKLHALKQNLAHRRIRDFLDVVELMQVNHLNPRDASVRETFEQFGTKEIYEKVLHGLS